MNNQAQTTEKLVEKWKDLLLHEDMEPIADRYILGQTAKLLENQYGYNQSTANSAVKQSLMEDTTVTGNIANFDPIMMSMVRRITPKFIGYQICGMQALTMPSGYIFYMQAKYGSKTGAEALFDKVDTDYSGTGTHTSENPFDPAFKTGTGMTTAQGETQPWAEMTATVNKVLVEAKTRNLRSDYSIELSQDWKNVHGMDADAELAKILSTEMLLEQNQELARTVYSIAKQGAQFGSTAGTFDLLADSDGRWSAERYKGLFFAIERDANQIAFETRRGKGNIVICSANVASALQLGGLLDFAPAIESMVKGFEIDVTGTAFIGNMGRYKVFVDPFLTTDGYVVGFKGAHQYDAGMFFCPYIPFQQFRAVDPKTFNQAIGFKTRYGICANPFTTMNPAQNIFYRKAKVTGLA